MERKVETSSISKRKKSRGKGKHVPTEEVGIGKLPDEMLCYILSFLETKDAVQTSVLSKQWRNVWTSVPCIDIRYPEVDVCFSDFGYRLLRLNTVSCLRRFRLSWIKDYEEQISEWISIVLKRDIEEIVLNHWGKQCFQLPPSIFTCKKLVILKINSKTLVDVPSSVYLPSLKILHIYFGKLFDKDSITIILDGCPVIDELNIQGVKNYNANTLFVQSSSIKILSICLGCFGRSSDLRVVVDAPNVERLDLKDWGKVKYDINSLSSLVNLKTNIRQSSGLFELLRKFTNTKYMEISHETLTWLEFEPLDDFPIFHNLTHLVVHFHEFSRTVLPVLLECSPNLVTLEFYSYSVDEGRSREEQQHHFKAPKCMMLYLEEIEIKGLKGFMHEMEMISYFLKNSMVLKKLSIQSIYLNAKKHSEISKKLLTFARSSPECQILFNS